MTTRRRGSVQLHRGRFHAVGSYTDPATGNRKRYWGPARTTKTEANKDLTAFYAQTDSRTFVEPSKQTLKDYLLIEWLPAIRTTVKPSTWDSYRRAISGHVVPRIGLTPLSKVTPAHLNGLYADLLDTLSPKTVRNDHTILHRALKDAVRWGKLAKNPADYADPPRVVKPEMTCWTGEDVRAFLGWVNEDRLHPLYLLACTTGMRRGELLGLRWSDLTLDTGRLSVKQTLISVAYKVQFSEPKTNRSRRTFSLDPATVNALKAWRSHQLEERLAWGPAWEDTGLVFTRENGAAIHPQALSDHFEATVKKAQLPKLSLHGLRHSYATLALASGMKPWDLSDRLGHASVAFTLSVYRHAIQGSQDDAATAAAAFILG